MILPKELSDRIFLMYLELQGIELRNSLKSIDYLRSYNKIFVFSDFYKFPYLYIFHKWKNITENQATVSQNQLVQLMRYIMDNRYRICLSFVKNYHNKIYKLAHSKIYKLYPSSTLSFYFSANDSYPTL